MILAYQRNTLKAKVNTWLGTMLLASVAFAAGLTIWHAATGENLIVQAFTKAVERQTVLEDL